VTDEFPLRNFQGFCDFFPLDVDLTPVTPKHYCIQSSTNFFSHQIDELRQARQTHERLSLPVRGTSSLVLHKKAVSEHASEASLYKLAETVFTFLDQVFLLSCWAQCIVDVHVGIKTPEYTLTVVILAHRSCVKILLFFVYTTPTCRGGNGTCSRLNNG
jgi:hypothetical protein